jgi:hypothetical protein
MHTEGSMRELSTISHLFFHPFLYHLDLGQERYPAIVVVVRLCACNRAHASANVHKSHQDHNLFRLFKAESRPDATSRIHLQNQTSLYIDARSHIYPPPPTQGHLPVQKARLIRLHVMTAAGAQPLDNHHLAWLRQLF